MRGQGGWQKGIWMMFRFPPRPYKGTKKSHDHVKKSMLEANHFQILIWLKPNKSQE